MNIRDLSELLQHATVTSSFGSTCGVFGGSEHLADSSDCILIVTDTALNLLRTSTYIYSCTINFSANSLQQWLVHCICTVSNNVVLRLCWILFENESEDAYITMFSLLRAKLGTWQFHFVICDDNPLQAESYKTIFGVQIVHSVHQNITIISRLAATHVETVRHHEQHWPLFRRIIHLCFALQFLPRSLILHGLFVVKKEIMDSNNFIFNLLWPIIEILSRPPLNFTVCGCPEKTNYAREILARDLRQVCMRHQHRVQPFIRNILRMAQTTLDDEHLLRLGRRPLLARPSRICSPLSDDTQISVLTGILRRPTMTLDFLILNFLQEVAKIVIRHSAFYDNTMATFL